MMVLLIAFIQTTSVKNVFQILYVNKSKLKVKLGNS